MKNILYNFILTLKRYKTASALNILGLSVAFAIFIIILSQLWWQYTYNDNIPQSDQVYVLAYDYDSQGEFSPTISRPNGEAVAQSVPQVKSYGIMRQGNHVFKEFGNTKDSRIDIQLISPSIIELIGMKIVEGDSTRFSEPNAIMLPRSLATKYFGDKSPVGELIDDKYQIVAIFQDIPSNSTFKNKVMVNLHQLDINSRGNLAYSFFFKFPPNQETAKKITDAYIEQYKDYGWECDAELIPMDKLYFYPNINHYQFPNVNLPLSYVLLSVAIVVLLIAVANYINFFLSLVPVRIKAVNISKVFGASVGALRWNVIFEAVGIMLLAFGVSLFFVDMLSGVELIRFAGEGFVFGDNVEILIGTGIFAVALGLISGLFPAWYITKFSPSMVLAGSFGRSRRGRALRLTLSTFQFTSSIVLVVVSLFIILQNSFMRDFDYGYSRERLYHFQIPNSLWKDASVLTNELLKNPDIQGVAYSNGRLTDPYASLETTIEKNGQEYNFPIKAAGVGFIKFMGLELIEGRDFVESDKQSKYGSVIINETAAQKYNIKVGEKLGVNEFDVVGIVKDYHYGSLRDKVEPMGLGEFGQYYPLYATANVRIAQGANLEKTKKYILDALIGVASDTRPEDVDIQHIDSSIEENYQKEGRLATIIIIFSLVTILISLIGVMGTVIFDLQHRRKEVSVRKVFGASVRSILGRFNRGVLWILIISTLIGVPLAWYVVSSWLENFAHRVPMYWWVFVGGVVIVAVIVFSLVTLQTWRTANANPTKFLKSE